MATFTKQTFGRAADWEVAGLEWLRAAEAEGGARIVKVQGQDADGLHLEQLEQQRASAAVAREFGAALYHTHQAGAAAFGVGPAGWEGDGYFGPNEDLQTISLQPYDSWGAMYAESRLQPMIRNCRSLLGDAGVDVLDRLCARLTAGDFDDVTTPARLHGDLWNGNVLWTPDGVVLIDPSAQGGHPVTDLAALSLFGCSQLSDIYAGYEEAAGDYLPDEWRDLIPLHQLSMLLMHVQVFGGSYVNSTLTAASKYV